MVIGAFDRSTSLAALGTRSFDVVIVGGGITGAGAALDASSRGLRTALIERDDFASGTSSKSSKLVHGGLRYLQQREFRLVYEALLERQRLLRNAPHLVREMTFLLPIFARDGLINRKLARALGSAMWLYDLTGGARIGKLHERVTRDEVMAHCPWLRADRVAGGYLYYDCATDDARLTLALVRTAALDYGAVAANRVAMTGVEKDDRGRIVAVEARPEEGPMLRIATRSVVNATGVWADRVRGLDEPGSVTLRPARGVHVTVPRRLLDSDVSVILPVSKDRRSVFVVPWGESSYIGTTDTDDGGDLDDPQCTAADIEYLLGAVNASSDAGLDIDDITATWAGLRPLVDDERLPERTADLSRRHRVELSDSGMLTITGGKLTTYRTMAADAVDAIVSLQASATDPAVLRRSRTRKLALRGADGHDEAASHARRTPHLSDTDAEHLAGRYGGETAVLVAMIEREPSLAQRIDPALPYLAVEVVHAARYEMVTHLDDVLARRTRALLRNASASVRAAPSVARLVGDELGWDADRIDAEVAAFWAGVEHERASAHLPPSFVEQAS